MTVKSIKILTLINNNDNTFLLLLLLLLSFIFLKTILCLVVFFGEITHLFYVILSDPTKYLIYGRLSYTISSLLLFGVKVYINDIMRETFLDYIGESLGGLLTFTLFIRSYFFSDDR